MSQVHTAISSLATLDILSMLEGLCLVQADPAAALVRAEQGAGSGGLPRKPRVKNTGRPKACFCP